MLGSSPLSGILLQTICFLSDIQEIFNSILNLFIHSVLYLFFHGVEPALNNLPRPQDGYTPSVFVAMATDGLGQAISFYLAESGYTVFAAVSDQDDVRALLSAAEDYKRSQHEISPFVGKLIPLICNPLECHSINDAIFHMKQQLRCDGVGESPLIALVNNPGFCMLAPTEYLQKKDLMRLLDRQLEISLSLTRSFLPILKAAGGRIINIGHYGTDTTIPGWTSYCAVTSAVESIMKSWSREVSHIHGVRMTIVKPNVGLLRSVGPSVLNGISAYQDSYHAIGFFSDGTVVHMDTEDANRNKRLTLKQYRSMIDCNIRMLLEERDLMRLPTEVGAIVVRALTDPWMQASYTVHSDEAFMTRFCSLLPDPLREWLIMRNFR